DGTGNIAEGSCTVQAPAGAAAVVVDSQGTQRLSGTDASAFEATLAHPGAFFVRVGGGTVPPARDAISLQATLPGGDRLGAAWFALRSERDPEGAVKAATVSVDVDGTNPNLVRLTGPDSPSIELRTGRGGAKLEIGPDGAARVADLERSPELAQLEV